LILYILKTAHLAYPLENFWILLKNAKNRNQKGQEQSNKLWTEEWTKSTTKISLKRLIVILFINGNGLDIWHLQKIRIKKEEEEEDMK